MSTTVQNTHNSIKQPNTWLLLTATILLFTLAACAPLSRATAAANNPPITASDSDTNNLHDPVADNNQADSAQILASPLVLTGYLSVTPSRQAGDRFEEIADPEDWYRLSLKTGDLITLTIVDHDGVASHQTNPDFDLYLVDPDSRKDLQRTEEQNDREYLRVLRSGSYLLLVKAHRGAGDYRLQVSAAPPLPPGVTPQPGRAAEHTVANPLKSSTPLPNDPYFSQQWSAAMLHLPAAWQQTTGSEEVVIAILDSGILSAHPDLAGQLCRAGEDCAGYDFVADPASSGDGDGIDADPEDPGVVGPANLIPYHGTQLAGILGAIGNNRLGIAGVDWHARIMPVRVIGSGERSSYDLQQGLRYAAGLSNDSGVRPRQPAKIISLSLGGGGYLPAEQELFAQLRDAGIFVVAAAGNQASILPVYPAAYAEVLAVTAVNRRKEAASYANFGPAIDIAAPGGEPDTGQNSPDLSAAIFTTSGDPLTTPPAYSYAPISGTSIAAPQVAGVIALMLAIDPELTPAEFQMLLSEGQLTEDLGEDGLKVRNDRFGYGLIDAAKALRAVINP